MIEEAPSPEWLNNPINAGSIYIKPREDKTTMFECIFKYCWYYCFPCKTCF